jgi:hypothetical protein
MPMSMIEASALQRLVYRQDPGVVLSFVCVVRTRTLSLRVVREAVDSPWSSGDRSEKK